MPGNRAAAIRGFCCLANAFFRQANGERLPFEDGTFDAAFCYDVFTNFPSLDDGVPLIDEMLRTVRVGGKVLIGNIPDRALAPELPARVAEISREMDRRYGRPYEPRRTHTDTALTYSYPNNARPGIVTYDFTREEFLNLDRRLGAAATIHESHVLNPYFKFRFNSIFCREVV